MRPKTARRFLNRNSWKIAKLKILYTPEDFPNNSFTRRIVKAYMSLNND